MLGQVGEFSVATGGGVWVAAGVLTDKLSAGLKIVHAAVTKEMVEEEERLLAEILASLEDLTKSDA
jgi:hypothetical protein